MVEINGPKQLLVNTAFVSAFPVIVILTTPVTIEKVIGPAADNVVIAAGIGLVAVFLILFGKSGDRTHHGHP